MSVFTPCLFRLCLRDTTPVYSTTWTRSWARALCLVAENNNDVIGNLAPCVKLGGGGGGWNLAFISGFHSQSRFTANIWLSSYRIPPWDWWNSVSAAGIPAWCPILSLSVQSELMFTWTLHVAARWQIISVKWLMAAMPVQIQGRCWVESGGSLGVKT